VSRAAFKFVDRRVPARCTLWFSVAAVPEDLYDPTPDNNVVAVELNVYDDDAKILDTEDEVLIQSVSPTLVKIPRGQTSVIEQVKPTILRAGKKVLEDAGMDVIVTAGDGDCPKGTIGITDFDRCAAGTQNRMVLRRGKRARGMLALVVRGDAFASTTDESPRRCTAVLTISGARGHGFVEQHDTPRRRRARPQRLLTGPLGVPILQHPNQVRHARIAAELLDERCHLTAVMRLMIEEVGEDPPERMSLRPTRALVFDRAGQRTVVERSDPLLEKAIRHASLGA
jgi:hypothetical protein